MAFHVGQKVVCVNNGNSLNTPNAKWRDGERPAIGAVYTVRSIHLHEIGGQTLWLNEICRCDEAVREYGPSVGYGSYRFRPVIERKTDISIFTEMLTPKVKERA